MSSSEAWAQATIVTDILLHGYKRAHVLAEPSLAAEALTESLILCGAPLERFSERRPFFNPSGPDEEEWRPIDILYGSYDPTRQTIDIYIENIAEDAHLFGDFDDFLHIVRLHEYAHAVLHLGVRTIEVVNVLRSFEESGCTDWSVFVKNRTRIFQEVDSPSHELIAQAVTWGALTRFPDQQRASRLIDTFENLERRQPRKYVLPDEVKSSSASIDWQVLMAAARRDIDAYREPDFVLYDGLVELARHSTAFPDKKSRTSESWTVTLEDQQAIDKLKRSLESTVPRARHDAPDGELRALVDRFQNVRIEVFANEHPPPHFRVVCQGETANYRISDCHQLNGGLHREYRAIRKWHSEHKRELINAWNRHRPSDCPVGEYRPE